jgi:hypothetical protein
MINFIFTVFRLSIGFKVLNQLREPPDCCFAKIKGPVVSYTTVAARAPSGFT